MGHGTDRHAWQVYTGRPDPNTCAKDLTCPIAPTKPQGAQQAAFTPEGAPPPGAVGAAHVAYTPLSLNITALQAMVQEPRSGLAAAEQTPWVNDVIALFNGALATEWVCVLRYRRHHFTAKGLASVKVAEEFLTHSNEEMGHADRLARRIVQLGGLPDFSPATLLERSHVPYDDPLDLESMIKCNWLAVCKQGFCTMSDQGTHAFAMT